MKLKMFLLILIGWPSFLWCDFGKMCDDFGKTEAAANQGDAEAQYILAKKYHYGEGV